MQGSGRGDPQTTVSMLGDPAPLGRAAFVSGGSPDRPAPAPTDGIALPARWTTNERSGFTSSSVWCGTPGCAPFCFNSQTASPAGQTGEQVNLGDRRRSVKTRHRSVRHNHLQVSMTNPSGSASVSRQEPDGRADEPAAQGNGRGARLREGAPRCSSRHFFIPSAERTGSSYQK